MPERHAETTPALVDVRVGIDIQLHPPVVTQLLDAAARLPTEQGAKGFYAVHKERPFYGDLVKFMTSGPVVALVLEGEGAIKKWRDLMGPTNSNEAPAGTLRGDFGTDIEQNATHGSDAPETARLEISYFFNAGEIVAVSRPRASLLCGKMRPES